MKRESEKCYAVDVQKQDLYCVCTSPPMCGFIAQLVEQRTGNAEVTGSNPVEALIFFRLLLSDCLNWNIYCDDHSSLSRSIFFVLVNHKYINEVFGLNPDKLNNCSFPKAE